MEIQKRYVVTLDVWIRDIHKVKKIQSGGFFPEEAENNAYDSYEQQLFRAGHEEGDFEIDICGCELVGGV